MRLGISRTYAGGGVRENEKISPDKGRGVSGLKNYICATLSELQCVGISKSFKTLRAVGADLRYCHVVELKISANERVVHGSLILVWARRLRNSGRE